MRTDLLIIGAGPFGLALAAFAQEQGLAHTLVGAPMGFWSANMPGGMFLRSTCDWSLDPLNVHSIDAYLQHIGRDCSDVEPLSRDFYLDYVDWFQREKGIKSLNILVEALWLEGNEFVAVTDSGKGIRSRFVVLALGFGNFVHVPTDLANMFPRERYDHTCHLVDFERLRGQRVLVIGGRQSAFEWAALMREAGVGSVDLSYRHATPAFTASDWSWVSPLVGSMVDDPGWYARLPQDEKQQISDRLWSEGRLKLEPWLAGRIDHPNVHLHPQTEVAKVSQHGSGMRVTLNNGNALTVDHVVFATGYQVDMARIPLLTDTILSGLSKHDGFPVLGDDFQTSVPGLFVTSLAATRHFGPFLGFTVAARTQAQIIGRAIMGKAPGPTLPA